MQRDLSIIETAIENAAQRLSHQGGRVTVICSGGARIEGDWIELSGGRLNKPKLTVFSEAGRGIGTTHIDLQEVVAVGVESAIQDAGDRDARVLPSQREMTLAAILMQNWGRVEGPVSYGMMLDALDQIDGTGAKYRSAKTEDMPLDQVSVSMIAHVEKVLLALASKIRTDQVLTMPIWSIFHDKDLQSASTAALRTYMAQSIEGKSDEDNRQIVGRLPHEILDEVAGRLRLAMARKEAKATYHAFILRDEWDARLRHC